MMEGKYSERLSNEDVVLLRDLARQISEIAADPIMEEKAVLWTRLNGLKKTRPMILCVPQAGWQEIVPVSDYLVKDPFFGEYEQAWKKTIYKYHNFQDDEVVTDTVYVPYTIEMTDWVENRERPFSNDYQKSGAFHPCIHDYSDLRKMKFPTATLNIEKSNENFELAKELFGDCLNVVQGVPLGPDDQGGVMGWGNSLIDIWCELRGLEQVFSDLILEPELTKEAMQFLMDGTINYLKQGEKEGFWQLNNNGYMAKANTPCGSNGLAYTDELPAEDFAGRVRLKDLWLYTMAQEFTCVSPAMLEEFVLPYQLEIQKLFGMNAYGCCENCDQKWDLITNTVPNLRVLSVAPHGNLQLAVETLEDRYVLCWRPNPGLILGVYNREKNREILKEEMRVAEGSHLNVSLREIHTVYNNPRMLSEWVEDALELAMEYA